MAIVESKIRNGNGITFTYVVDSPLDWSGITNSTYFKNLSDGLIYYKNNDGLIIGIYDIFTGGTVNGSTTFTQPLSASTLFVNGVQITGDTNFATNDLTFTGNRYHNIDGNELFIYDSGGLDTTGPYLYNNPIFKYISIGHGNREFLDIGAVNGTSGFTFTTNYLKRMVLDVNGNLGIGTQTPTEKLTISGNTDISGTLNIGTMGIGSPVINLGLDSNGYVVTGTTGGSGVFTGGTVNGATNFTNGLSANTISATTIGSSGNCVTDLYVSNIHSCSPLNINPLDEGNVYFGVSAMTVDLLNDRVGVGLITPTAKFHVNNTTSSKSFLVEDSTNPDSTPFVIDSNGSVSIGTTNVFSVGAGLPTSLNITSSGPSGVSYTGLGVSTPLVVESSIGASIAVLSPNTANAQIYFGTPSDAFGSYLRWDYTNRNLVLSTANSTGKIVLQTNNGIEAARILSNGDVGIGTNSPTTKLDVNGKTKTTNLQVTSGATNGYVLTSDASGNASWQPSSGGGSGTTVTAFTYSDNNFTISQVGETDLITNISVMTGLTINGNFNVNGNSVLSGSGQNVLTIIGSGNSISSPLFSIQGSSGELFSISDSLVGSLFSVNDISGLPILEVFSDNTTLWGSFQSPSLNTTVKINTSIGLNTIYSIPISAYTGAWFDYTVKNSSGARTGQIMSIFSGSSVQYNETTTNDIGTTTPINFSVTSDGINASLKVSATTSNWEVKIIVRSI